MNTKISISLDEELVKLIKKEASRAGRSVSEVFADAIRAYQREKRRKAYLRFKLSLSSKEKLKEDLMLFEKAQLEDISRTLK